MVSAITGQQGLGGLPWTQPAFSEFQEIVKRLDALDRKLGLPDCHDPAKAAWMREVEARLKALETPK